MNKNLNKSDGINEISAEFQGSIAQLVGSSSLQPRSACFLFRLG